MSGISLNDRRLSFLLARCILLLSIGLDQLLHQVQKGRSLFTRFSEELLIDLLDQGHCLLRNAPSFGCQ